MPGLERVGFPIAEIDEDGACTISKAENTGGLVTERTVKEQLLYEVHDPAAYLTPDVTADICAGRGGDRRPRPRANSRACAATRGPSALKVTVCHEGGWLAEGEISYAGPGAEARARLAGDVLRAAPRGTRSCAST